MTTVIDNTEKDSGEQLNLTERRHAMKKRMVVVTTDKDRRGVFFGELLTEEGDVVELADAKMAVYWSNNVKGVLGLASIGPQKGCRITPLVPKIKVNGVTSIMDCSDEAIKAWGEERWD